MVAVAVAAHANHKHTPNAARRVNCIDLMITLILSRVKRVTDRSRPFNYHFKLAKKANTKNGKLLRSTVELNLISLFCIFSFDLCGCFFFDCCCCTPFLCANFD